MTDAEHQRRRSARLAKVFAWMAEYEALPPADGQNPEHRRLVDLMTREMAALKKADLEHAKEQRR